MPRKGVYEDFTGRTYVYLFVEGLDYIDEKGKRHWRCKCKCGNYISVYSASVKSGNTKSCGCLKIEFEDLTGETFKYWYVIKFDSFDKHNIQRWLCECRCGTKRVVLSTGLKSGRSQSCGCYAKIVWAKQRGPKNPAWNHSISTEEREDNKIRNYNPKYKRWRKKVYKRDNYTCQVCGDNKGGNLVAHHVYAWNKYKDLHFITSNGITLCDKCHKLFHKIYKHGNNTRKQFTKFKKDYGKNKIS